MEGSSVDRVRLSVFGGLRVETPESGLIDVRSRRARALIAYLLLTRGRSAPREKLAGLLWSDRGEEQARASLRQCLLELRYDLTPSQTELLHVGRDVISLRQGIAAPELHAVEAALSARNPDSLAGILETIGSEPLLDGLAIGGLFGEWLDQVRANFEQRLAQATHACLEDLEAAADWPGVRRLAQALLSRQPLDEAVVAAAIRADIALGSTAAAHRRFKVLKEGLARDLGVEPSPAAREALTAVRPATPRGPLPSPPAARPELDAPEVRRLVVVAEFDTAGLGADAAATVRSIREEAVAGLSRFQDLCVITDPAALEASTIDAWARQGAIYALGATLRPASGGRRLAVQLLRTRHRQVIWSEVLELPEAGVGAAIDNIIMRVVGAVLPSIDTELARLPQGDIYGRYIAARESVKMVSDVKTARQAAADLQGLIDEAPDFIPPYLSLARLYNTDFWYTEAWSSGPAERDRALELAKAALSRDRGHVHGYTVAGWCYLRRQEWDVARAHFEQALKLNPFYADRVMEAGFGQLLLGDLNRARVLLDRCLMLNPAPKDNYFLDLGLLELLAGEHGRAASYLHLVASPVIWQPIYVAMNAALGGGELQRAAETARERIRAIWPAGQSLDVNDATAWMESHHPFASPELRAAFRRAARMMLEA